VKKAEVLAGEEQAWNELMEAISAVPAEHRNTEGVVPGWSTHDTVWHVGYWVGRVVDVLERAAQGPPYPEEPEEDSYYDAENDRAFARGRDMTWDEILEYHATSRSRAREVIEGCEDRDVEWLCARFQEEIDHYREHASQIRAFISEGV
jgi:hypothetical protein